MTRPVKRTSSLEELEGVRRPPPPADATRLVATAHDLRRRPIGTLDAEGLRLLITQDVGLPYLLPLAVELLRADPLVEGDLYEGDLLSAALTRAASAWSEVPDAARELRDIVSGPLGSGDLPPSLRAEAAGFLDVTGRA
ncbi:contact-dependent growth inhibition system immunity protein [Streptomyces eurocidicus]|uniref:Uncharacterized protein n=1 Tax=Streptomyces eurocidicus TaxID=66423 RepID=A0A7W8F6F5_STREU|nr:contact-dependent growth inhibition system immunity protein [Streptomyces eurocidicus]MBB5122960.1 hypothetical protein [Streptomyces eurocidicus]